jgi:hypothetical protein
MYLCLYGAGRNDFDACKSTTRANSFHSAAKNGFAPIKRIMPKRQLKTGTLVILSK